MNSIKESSVFFPLIFHFHQPYGNFDHIIENAYNKAYLPLVKLIQEYPKIKAHFHFCGNLLSWLINHHPEYLKQIHFLLKRGQIEILTGGFYEPILSMISDYDKIEQIKLLNDWWKNRYEIVPKGIWLAERVWVPHLPILLNQLKLEYTFLDSHLLLKLGFKEEETYNPFITEDQGKTIIICPINENLRYLVPWKKVDKTISYIRDIRDPQTDKMLVFSSDVEKLGEWPAGNKTTYEICYISGYEGKPWMEEFFEYISNTNWIKTPLLSMFLKKIPPYQLVYFPSSSYDKLSIWALPEPLRFKIEKTNLFSENQIKYYVSGSIFRNFLVKYSQANIMHKIMLYIRYKLDSLLDREIPISKMKYNLILRKILAAQSNDAYWHGLFGGVYLKHLRHQIYKSLIDADIEIDKELNSLDENHQIVSIIDVLLDGYKDGIMKNEYISCFVSSKKGGSIFALFFKKARYNFLNVLTPVQESYHSSEFSGIIDQYEKWAFQDHIVPRNSTPEQIQNNKSIDIGGFINKPYHIIENKNDLLALKRVGEVRLPEGQVPIKIIKKIRLEKNEINVNYSITVSSRYNTLNIDFVPEINLILNSHPYKTKIIAKNEPICIESTSTHENMDSIDFLDMNEQEMVCLTVLFGESCLCTITPIFSFIVGGLGCEKKYQGTSIFPQFPILSNNTKLTVKLILKSLIEA